MRKPFGFYPILVALAFVLTGCVSIPDINYASKKLETAWLIDYQKMEEYERSRVIDAPALKTFKQVERALVSLDLPILNSNAIKGEIIAEGIAPSPLTQEEWEQVVELEEERVSEISSGLLYLSDDPSAYVITVRISVKDIGDSTLVVTNYALSSPKYAAYGITLPRVAPPQAVVIGSLKFWRALDERLRDANVPTTREVKPKRRSA